MSAPPTKSKLSSGDGRLLGSTRLQRARSPFLQDRYARFLSLQHDQLRQWLPEVAAAPRDVRGELEAVTSYDSWDELRSTRGLGKARTRAAMERMASGLIAALPD